MKFDAIVGNPPYQVMDGGAQASATPIYNKFFDGGKSLNPLHISMIMPSRWMTGGKGLDQFRNDMINDKHISILHDHQSSKDCFEQVDIKGGICYLLWSFNYSGKASIFSYVGNNVFTSERYLKEEHDEIFIRDSRLISIKDKVSIIGNKTFDSLVSAMKPYGIRGDFFKDPSKYGLPKLTDTKIDNGFAIIGLNEKLQRVKKYMPSNYPIPKTDMLYDYKLFIPRNYGIGQIGEMPSSPVFAKPKELCTETFVQIGPFKNDIESHNCFSYFRTKLFRLLVGIKKQDQGAGKNVYQFVPLQDFTEKSDIDWSKSIAEIDKQLYAKYALDDSEIAFIESMIKPME